MVNAGRKKKGRRKRTGEEEREEAICPLEKNQPKKKALQRDQLPGGPLILTGGILWGLRSVPESCDTPGVLVP